LDLILILQSWIIISGAALAFYLYIYPTGIKQEGANATTVPKSKAGQNQGALFGPAHRAKRISNITS
jgi:hypothetical protein